MTVYAPLYYQKFHCIGGRCRHSCCVGWEVGIDEDALCRMAVVTGEFGERLKKAVDFDEGTFRLGEGDRCPMLREDGLCDLILHLGEDALPAICDEHPRYTHLLSRLAPSAVIHLFGIVQRAVLVKNYRFDHQSGFLSPRAT